MEPRAGAAVNGRALARYRLTNYAACRRPVNVASPDARDVIAYDVLAVDGNVKGAGTGGVSSRSGIASEREDRQEEARSSR